MIKEKYPLLGCFMFFNFYASQSTIFEADGYACKGYDKSRKQAEETVILGADPGTGGEIIRQ